VLVRPNHAATKRKRNVIIGDERSEKKLTLKKAPPAPAKVSTGLTGSDVNLAGDPTGLTDAQTGLIGVSRETRESSKSKTRPSLMELWPSTREKGLLRRRRRRSSSS